MDPGRPESGPGLRDTPAEPAGACEPLPLRRRGSAAGAGGAVTQTPSPGPLGPRGQAGPGSKQGSKQLPWAAIACGGGSVRGRQVWGGCSARRGGATGGRRPGEAGHSRWEAAGVLVPLWQPPCPLHGHQDPLVNSACTALPSVQTGRQPVPCLSALDAQQAEEGTEALGGGAPRPEALGLRRPGTQTSCSGCLRAPQAWRSRREQAHTVPPLGWWPGSALQLPGPLSWSDAPP